MLQARATGLDVASAGTITFHIAGMVGDQSPTGTGYSSTDLTTVTVSLSGTDPMFAVPVSVDLDGLTALVVTSVVNGDAAHGVDDVNLIYALVERGEE